MNKGHNSFKINKMQDLSSTQQGIMYNMLKLRYEVKFYKQDINEAFTEFCHIR